MGLDMYVHAKRYVSGWEFESEEKQDEYRALCEQFEVSDFVQEASPGAEVKFTVAYWRKANQIHEWFVRNVMGGKDNCHDHYLSREQIADLIGVCQRVLSSIELMPGEIHHSTIYDAEHPQGRVVMAPGELIADPRLAHSLLPTQSGFFFGSTDYDEGYVYDLRRTIEQLEPLLKMSDDWEFYYYPSW